MPFPQIPRRQISPLQQRTRPKRLYRVFRRHRLYRFCGGHGRFKEAAHRDSQELRPILHGDVPFIRKRGNILESPPISSWKILPRQKLVTDTGKVYSAAAIAALGDAVILKKEPYFPLGMLVNSDIPASPEPIREGTLVNRGTLRTAIASGRLIRLTVNLLPLPYRRADL